MNFLSFLWEIYPRRLLRYVLALLPLVLMVVPSVANSLLEFVTAVALGEPGFALSEPSIPKDGFILTTSIGLAMGVIHLVAARATSRKTELRIAVYFRNLSRVEIHLGGVSRVNRLMMSEAGKLAFHGASGFINSVIFLFAIAIVGQVMGEGLLHDARIYAFALGAIILAHRGILFFRVVHGFFGLNQEECLEFYEWLKKKSASGDDDFGTKAVEDLKNDFLTQLGKTHGSAGEVIG